MVCYRMAADLRDITTNDNETAFSFSLLFPIFDTSVKKTVLSINNNNRNKHNAELQRADHKSHGVIQY